MSGKHLRKKEISKKKIYKISDEHSRKIIISKLKLNKKNKKSLIIRLIIFFILINLILLGIAGFGNARYLSTFTGKGEAQTANQVVSILSDKNILKMTVSPMQDSEYIFGVSNYNEDKRTQTDYTYSIKIDTMENLPLDYELYTYNNNIKGTQNLLENNQTPEINMGYSADAVHNYILVCKWKDDYKDYRYSKTLDYVEVVVTAIQARPE